MIWEQVYKKALDRMAKDKTLLATETFCGFDVLPIEDGDVHIFVKVCRYSEKLLKEQPFTGGLLCNVVPVIPKDEPLKPKEHKEIKEPPIVKKRFSKPLRKR